MPEILAACVPDLAAERARIMALLPGTPAPWPLPVPGCDVLAWATTGLMHLTGRPGAAPRAPGAAVLGRAGVLASAVRALSLAAGSEVRVDLGHTLAWRARLRGWQRRGAVSVNGSCRLLACPDGWVAVNLARPDDVRSLPAVLGGTVDGDSWAALAQHAASRRAGNVAAAAQEVGIPAAALGSDLASPLRLSRPGRPGHRAAVSPLVLDLSAMWAGPLCASLLRQAGWQVLKVEDSRRPDGARSGPAAFYAELHRGIPAVRLDFSTIEGRAELARLAGRATVVVESSRPRALRRLGLHAEEWLAAAPGRLWVSITGYGRDDPRQRVAFGDDAAVAGGLIARDSDGDPVFCGDAIADPLTGLLAATAALAGAACGGGWLLDIGMAGVCAELARPSADPPTGHHVCRSGPTWTARHGDTTVAVLAW